MIPAKTRLDILESTFHTIDLETARFSCFAADDADWLRLVRKLENLTAALRVQLTDYQEALEFEEEADRQAKQAEAAPHSAPTVL